MKKEIYLKIDDLEKENVAAIKELSRLQSPNNKLSSDPAQQKKQMEELRKAQVNARTISATIGKFYDRIAEMESEDIVNNFMAGLDDETPPKAAE